MISICISKPVRCNYDIFTVSIKPIMSCIKYMNYKLQVLDSSQCEAEVLQREDTYKGCLTFILVFFLGKFSGVWCLYIECKQEQ